jgi:hypothetical protein
LSRKTSTMSSFAWRPSDIQDTAAPFQRPPEGPSELRASGRYKRRAFAAEKRQ